MNNQLIIIISKSAIIIGALLSVVYTFGVVWRVEKKLDLVFKLFLGAIISFTLSEIVILFEFPQPQLSLIINLGLRVAFIIFFLAGILETRNMLRKMDGEK